MISQHVKKSYRSREIRRHKEQWQLRKKGWWFLDIRVQITVGDSDASCSHSPLRANVRDTAICHYTKPELYLARAILRKRWGFILKVWSQEDHILQYESSQNIVHSLRGALIGAGKNGWFKNISVHFERKLNREFKLPFNLNIFNYILAESCWLAEEQ